MLFLGRFKGFLFYYEDNMKKHLGFAAGIIVGLLGACIIVIAALGVKGIKNIVGGTAFSASSNDLLLNNDVTGKLNFLNNIIDEKYLTYSDDLGSISKADGLYKGLFESLGDPYSEYYTAEEYKALSTSITGSFEGIGAAISENKATGEYVVQALTEKSPAEKYGVQVGDVFFTVDGKDVSGWTLSELVSNVRGEKGSTVKIVFLRGEAREKISLDIVRDSIKSKTVSVNMLDDETGYMIISSFENVTTEQFDEGLAELRKKGMKKMILDLRGNPGGNVEVCIHIADELLGEGTIVYTKDKNGKEDISTSDEKHKLGIPLAVLVDGGSASASEILSGAIKDLGAGVLVGKTTYGKGIVQDVYPLTDGSAIKVTTKKYYTPSGNNIQGTGIDPDYDVDFDSDAYVADGYDSQLEKAKEIISKLK